MASIAKSPKSRYWIAAFRDASGKQIRRSTRETDRKRALAVALAFERAAKSKGSPQRVRQVLSEFLRDHFSGDQALPQATLAACCQQWLAARKAETSPGTHRHYEVAVKSSSASSGRTQIARSKRSPARRSAPSVTRNSFAPP